jgi:hypothetical protein
MSALRIIFWTRAMRGVLGLRWGKFRTSIGGIARLRLDWFWMAFCPRCSNTLSFNVMTDAPFSHTISHCNKSCACVIFKNYVRPSVDEMV